MGDPFQPTWPRALFALAVATLGFLLPQEVPLEYYPLNNPSSGLQYLEITCAADTAGMVRIFLNTGRGYNDVDVIKIPISPTQTAYTYTFPLADAPIVGLRLAPFESGTGVLTITNFRIINRRQQEIHRFDQSDFQRSHQIGAVTSIPGGWKVAAVPNSSNSYSDIRLERPIVAEGMNFRNFQRCLLSWSYLSLMIWILLLAVYFALRCSTNLRAMCLSAGFLLFTAFLFAAVGNRGLISNTVRFALNEQIGHDG
jgi:hypothetical protein